MLDVCIYLNLYFLINNHSLGSFVVLVHFAVHFCVIPWQEYSLISLMVGGMMPTVILDPYNTLNLEI